MNVRFPFNSHSLQGLQVCLLQSSPIPVKWMVFPRFRCLFLVWLTTSLKHHYGSPMEDLSANWIPSYRRLKIGSQCVKSIIPISFSSAGGETKRLLPFGFNFYTPQEKIPNQVWLFWGQFWISQERVTDVSPASYCSIYEYKKKHKNKETKKKKNINFREDEKGKKRKRFRT